MSDLTWPYGGDLEAYEPDDAKAPTFLPKLLDATDDMRDER